MKRFPTATLIRRVALKLVFFPTWLHRAPKRHGGTIAALLLGSALLFAGPVRATQDGAALFASLCSGCHNGTLHPANLVYNAAGNAAIITAVNNAGMGSAGSAADFASIAAYLDTIKPTVELVQVPHNSPGMSIFLDDVIVQAAVQNASLKIIEEIVTVSAPAKGTVTYRVGNGFNQPSIATYTPNPGQSGVDAWTYRGVGARGTTTIRIASVNIAAATGSPSTRPDLNQHGLTGSWWEPATGGQGFEVEVFQNAASGTGSTFVSWFTYDTASGGPERQRWYTAQGAVVSGQPAASLTIFQNTGGNFNAPPVTTAHQVGSATLSFDTCTNGQLAYNFTDGTNRVGVIPLTRLTQNVTCSTATPHPLNADFGYSGNWFSAATSGQGMTVEVNSNSAALFAAWYTYIPNGTTAGEGGQRWYTAQGAFAAGNRSIPVQIFETSGGVFDAPTPPGQKTIAVGSGTLAFQSCSSATFSYNFTAGSSQGLSGNISLSRVGPVPPGCAP